MPHHVGGFKRKKGEETASYLVSTVFTPRNDSFPPHRGAELPGPDYLSPQDAHLLLASFCTWIEVEERLSCIQSSTGFSARCLCQVHFVAKTTPTRGSCVPIVVNHRSEMVNPPLITLRWRHEPAFATRGWDSHAVARACAWPLLTAALMTARSRFGRRLPASSSVYRPSAL